MEVMGVDWGQIGLDGLELKFLTEKFYFEMYRLFWIFHVWPELTDKTNHRTFYTRSFGSILISILSLIQQFELERNWS